MSSVIASLEPAEQIMKFVLEAAVGLGALGYVGLAVIVIIAGLVWAGSVAAKE
jgi:hypothetical protein